MVEAVPESSDRMYVAKKLCDDKRAKRTLRNCMRAKSFFMIKDLDAEQLDSMTNKYRVCVRDAMDPDRTTTVAMMDTDAPSDADEVGESQ